MYSLLYSQARSACHCTTGNQPCLRTMTCARETFFELLASTTDTRTRTGWGGEREGYGRKAQHAILPDTTKCYNSNLRKKQKQKTQYLQGQYSMREPESLFLSCSTCRTNPPRKLSTLSANKPVPPAREKNYNIQYGRYSKASAKGGEESVHRYLKPQHGDIASPDRCLSCHIRHSSEDNKKRSHDTIPFNCSTQKTCTPFVQ